MTKIKMAFAAVSSLIESINQLQYFTSHKFAKIHYPKSHFNRLRMMLQSIKGFDFEENSPEIKSLEKEIKDALCRAQDIIESYMLTHLFSSETEGSADRISPGSSSKFNQDLIEVMQEIESGKEKMEKFAEDLKNGKEDPAPTSLISSSDDSSSQCKNKMVGLDSELQKIKGAILDNHQPHLGAAVIHGMGGIGKTSLVEIFYNDPDVRNHFEVGAWVKISLEHCVRDILLNLFHTVELFGHGRLNKMSNYKKLIETSDDEELANFVRWNFVFRRYLVVVDCVSNMNRSSWDYMKSFLPDPNNGSRIILVNRMRFEDDEFVFHDYEKCFLDERQSWNLLREQVFGDEPCPRELEKLGKKIAANCQGLPLAIITTGVHLAKTEEKTVEYWNKVAESGNSIAYAADGEAMFQKFWLSYKQLPIHLRPMFLYMAVLREDGNINYWKLANLWVAEGFLSQEESRDLFNSTWTFVVYFINRHLVLYRLTMDNSHSIHDAQWHFCCNQAKKEEFFHFIDKYNDWKELEDNSNISSIRRMIIWRNVLFSVKNASESKCSLPSSNNIRSLLLAGPFHPYPLRIHWSCYKMLKILDALSIRFYEFPDEILYLMMLEYLALTLNTTGELPPRISKLRSLKFLIVTFHQIVRSFSGDPLYLPTEIWEMRQLIHLHVLGSDLPFPPHSDASLPNLLSLAGVGPHSCTKEVLERIPNLKRLIIFIDLAPKSNVDAPPLHHLVLLKHLEFLQCDIINPYFEGCQSQHHVRAMPSSVSTSMTNLKVLVFDGCGFSWESIKQISQLPFLGDLVLKNYAFRGPKWELTNTGFKQLYWLTLSDLDLVYWTARSGDHFFPRLHTLQISRCYNLTEITPGFVNCRDLQRINVEHSSSAAEAWARSIQTEPSIKVRQRISYSTIAVAQ